MGQTHLQSEEPTNKGEEKLETMLVSVGCILSSDALRNGNCNSCRYQFIHFQGESRGGPSDVCPGYSCSHYIPVPEMKFYASF